MVRSIGFEDVRVGEHRHDVFSDAPSASSAEKFGTEGITIFARKPER